MPDQPGREALARKVRGERRAAVGVRAARDETTVEIVRDDPAEAERLWDKPRGRSAAAAWAAVFAVFTASVVVAFAAGFAAVYVYAAMK